MTVNSIPDSPVVTETIEAELNEDYEYIIILQADDVDFQSILNFEIVDSTSSGSLILENSEFNNTGTVYYTPNLNFNGIDSFTYRAIDETNLFSNTGEVILNILPINDAPVINEISDQQTNEDIQYSNQISVNDVDDDLLNYSVNQVDNATIWFEQDIINVLPDLNWFGVLNIEFSVSDGMISVSDNFILEVISVNDSPIAQNITEHMSEEGTLIINLNEYTEDVDNISLQYSLSDSSMFGTVSLNETNLMYLPNENYFGYDSLLYIVSDSELQDSAWINIYVENIDDIPELPIIENSSIDEDNVFTTQLPIQDFDEEILNYNIILDNQDNASANIDQQGILSITPVENWNGNIDVIIEASDLTSTVSEEFTLTVFAVNDTPIIVSNPNLFSLVNQLYEYQVIVSDPDNEYFYFQMFYT